MTYKKLIGNTAILFGPYLIIALLVAIMSGVGAQNTPTAQVRVGIKFKKEDLIGAWTYHKSYTEFPDGRKQVQFGEFPEGLFVIMANGYYSHIIMSPDLPRLRSGRFKESSIEEAERIAEGVLAHFGTWEADEDNGSFSVRIKKSSYPNFDGVTQIRFIMQLDENVLVYVNDRSVVQEGARVYAELRRLR